MFLFSKQDTKQDSDTISLIEGHQDQVKSYSSRIAFIYPVRGYTTLMSSAYLEDEKEE